MSLARSTLGFWLLLPCLFAGCTSPPPPLRGVTATLAPSPAPSPSPAASASAPSNTAPGMKPTSPRRFTIEERPVPEDIDAETGVAPCDFARSYRGEIGKTKVTLLLRAPSSTKGASFAIEGLSHYDKDGPAIPIAGSTTSDGAFVVSEKPGGTFTGRCDASSGVLRGRFTLGKRAEAFELRPRPAAWPGLYRVRRRATTRPNHPVCKTAAKPDTVVEVSIDPAEDDPRAICLPTNPVKRKELLADAPDFGCSAVDEGYRVFGLAKRGVEESVNSALAGGLFEEAVKEIQQCTGHRSSHRSMTLVAAWQDFLVVGGFSSQDYGGAHPMNSGMGGMALNLRDGHAIRIDDLVDVRRLRDVAAACLPIYAQASSAKVAFEVASLAPASCGNEGMVARYLWGCDKNDLSEPNWALLPEGIVIGGWANPHVSAVDDGHGPVLSWATLKREGILRADSQVAHLWAHVSPASADAPACSIAFEGSILRIWREQGSLVQP